MLGFGAISEQPISALSDASSQGSQVYTQQPADTVAVRDELLKHLFIRISEAQHVSDATVLARTGLQTVQTSDNIAVRDDVVKQLFLRISESAFVSDNATTNTGKTASFGDTQHVSDALRLQHHRVFPDNFIPTDQHRAVHKRVFDDRLTVADSVTLFAQTGATVVASDNIAVSDALRLQQQHRIAEQQDIQDAVFLQQLMRELRATDHQTFAEQVLLSLITRDLLFRDNIHLSDAALLQLFSESASGSIEDILAGIRTFTCTPGYDLQREAITKTAVADFDQPGLFSATNGAARPAYRFVINISALTRIQQESLSAFHFFHQGGKAFFIDGFRAWDNVSTLNLIGEGDGTKKEFFLPNRHINPSSITVAVFDGATHSITTAFSLFATAGMIRFATAPSSGHDIEASHAHKYKVLFEPDGLKTDEFASGVWRAQLKLRELMV